MNCSCGRPSRSRKSAECSACYRRRRYHEDPEFRRKAIAGAADANGRRHRREAEELSLLRVAFDEITLVVDAAADLPFVSAARLRRILQPLREKET